MATLLLLLEVGTAARDEGNGLERGLLVSLDNPPLAPPEWGEGGNMWCKYSSGTLGALERLGKPDFGLEFN